MFFVESFTFQLTKAKTMISRFRENLNNTPNYCFIKSPIISYVILSLLVIRILPFFPGFYVYGLLFFFIALQLLIDVYIFPRSKVFRYIETVCSFYLFSKFRNVRKIIYKILSFESRRNSFSYYLVLYMTYTIILCSVCFAPRYRLLEGKPSIAIASIIYIIIFLFMIYVRIRTSFLNAEFIDVKKRTLGGFDMEQNIATRIGGFNLSYKNTYADNVKEQPSFHVRYSFPFPDHFSKNSSEHIAKIADFRKITPFILALFSVFSLFLIYLDFAHTGIIADIIRYDQITKIIEQTPVCSDMICDHLKDLVSLQTEYKDKIRGYLPFIWEAAEPILNAQLKRNNIPYTIAKLREILKESSF